MTDFDIYHFRLRNARNMWFFFLRASQQALPFFPSDATTSGKREKKKTRKIHIEHRMNYVRATAFQTIGALQRPIIFSPHQRGESIGRVDVLCKEEKTSRSKKDVGHRRRDSTTCIHTHIWARRLYIGKSLSSVSSELLPQESRSTGYSSVPLLRVRLLNATILATCTI